ncbi:MAG: hypothetical protein MJZ67_06325 [Bacteroidales bacterium]|nr:hypothetical protein [Bacteroidales bacterium]
MKLLPNRRVFAAKNMPIWITNHYCPTLFGIRGHYDASFKSGVYVETTNPGTGFFVRHSSSRSYRSFADAEKEKLNTSYWDYIFGREFNFDKEIERANVAIAQTNNPIKKRILESYLNVLPMAQEVEKNERMITGIKALGHRHHKLTSYQSRVISNFKSINARLGHDVRKVQLSVPDMYSEEEYNKFAEVVKTFAEMANCHHIWHSRENMAGDVTTNTNALEPVFFDMGIFDFIQSPLMTPMMRDSYGNTYYLYPTFLVCARDGVDFDVYDLKDLTFHNRQVPYDSIASSVLDTYARGWDDGGEQKLHRRSYEEYGDGLLVSQDAKASMAMEKEDRERERKVGDMEIIELKTRFYIKDNKAFYKFTEAITSYIANL